METLGGWKEFLEEAKNHKRCDDPELEECTYCGFNDCPHDEPLHYHHDGCPACINEECEDCGGDTPCYAHNDVSKQEGVKE